MSQNDQKNHCVHIVLSAYHPDQEFLAQQFRSLKWQTHSNWRLFVVIADTVSADLVHKNAKDEGIELNLVQPEMRLDAVRAFELGLSQAVRAAELTDHALSTLYAFCDQDDVWQSDRLTRGISTLQKSKADLVHSDARLVNSTGEPTQHSMFRFERRHKRPGLRGLLYRNNITGMTALFTHPLAKASLPFPAQNGVHFYHDLWLGLMASAMGGIALIKEPLVDYRQHDQNVIGAVDRQTAPTTGLSTHLKRLVDPMWIRREVAAYALARYLAHETTHRIDMLKRDGVLKDESTNTKALRPYLRTLRGIPVFLWDSLRLALTGHLRLARLAMGHAIAATARMGWSGHHMITHGLRHALADFDTRLFSLSPGVEPSVARQQDEIEKTTFQACVDTRKIPKWEPAFDAQSPVINVLVPTLNPTEIFAGIFTAIDIGLGLAARGHHVRFIATDLPVSSRNASMEFLLGRLSAQAIAQTTQTRISMSCSIESETISSHKSDRFIATAWWSAHAADQLIREHSYNHADFFYLIQDFEPNFYSWGQEYADAMASYELNFTPIFNTTVLRQYFLDQGFTFAHSNALSFHPSISLEQYSKRIRPPREAGPMRLAVYGRPEVDRNMFPTAVEALSRFIKTEGLTPDDIELVSVGLKHAPVELPEGHILKSLGKLPLKEYPDFLLGTDLGLSLMYSPHPSHPPLEMAASGVRVVTNSFGPKNLSDISPAIISASPNVNALTETLSKAWALRHTPIPSQDRQIDLAKLGLPMETMIETLSPSLSAQSLSAAEQL